MDIAINSLVTLRWYIGETIKDEQVYYIGLKGNHQEPTNPENEPQVSGEAFSYLPEEERGPKDYFIVDDNGEGIHWDVIVS